MHHSAQGLRKKFNVPATDPVKHGQNFLLPEMEKVLVKKIYNVKFPQT